MDTERPPCAAYRFERFTLDLPRGMLLAPDGAELPLRPKSFALLQLFLENAERLLDRETIMQAIWPDVFVTDDSITQCVGEIRRALGSGAQRLLQTLPRRGYRFAAEVARAGSGTSASDVEGTSPQPLAAREPAEPTRTSTVVRAERRQLTVLFCDLVGSTALAERLDPEDLGEVLRAYQERCTAAVVRSGGHVAKYLGDGVLAYFGYPHAQEDAAERAVRAGLAIVEATDGLKPRLDPTLRVRVGIATGLVVSDLAGEGGQGELTAGKPLNLAARLQAIAEPGTVVIAEGTRRLVGELFMLEDLGRLLLKGFTAAVQAWRVTGEGAAEGRFEALRGANLTPMVGRRQELTLLLNRWEQAKEGEGQVILLAGEPGIGKSRLLSALRERLRNEPHARLACHCSPYHDNTALFPILDQLARAADLDHADEPATRLDKLEALVRRSAGDPAETVPLLAALLNIPLDEHHRSLDLTPERFKARALEILLEHIAGHACEGKPALVLLEDAQWLDPSSRELLDLFVERIQRLRMLLVVTFRSEFGWPWTGFPHMTLLTLNRLGRTQASGIVVGVLGGRALPAEVLDQVLAKADGVPLFVEELTKVVLEGGFLREESGHYVLDGPLPQMAVPPTLHDSLLARLDRLGPAKAVAQLAAVIGREFPHELLARIADREEGNLADALRQLVAAELVFRCGTPSRPAYIFKHALIRDAAYSSLLTSQRRLLHARVAEVLEESSSQAGEAEPSVLAFHCTEAGLTEQAIAYWHKAGQCAIARSAMTEAVAHFTTALELMRRKPGTVERKHGELELQVALGGALLTAKGWASPEMGQAYARARELCRELDERSQLISVLHGLFVFHQNRAELAEAREVAEDLLHIAEQRGDASGELLGHRMLGSNLLFQAHLGPAKAHLEYVTTTNGPRRHTLPAFLPLNPRVAATGFLAWVLLFQGYPDQALTESRAALVMARELGHPYGLAYGLQVSCVFHQVRRDRLLVGERSAALVEIAAEQGFPHLFGIGTFFRGWAKTIGDKTDEGIAEMGRGLAAERATGAEIKVPYCLCLLAAAHLAAGRSIEALPFLAEAFDRVEKTQERWFEAELHRTKGELLLLASDEDDAAAEACFCEAMEVACRQGARLWELRAAASLARLWQAQGRHAEALGLLGPIYAWFTEGFAIPDLQDAKRLLVNLGQRANALDDCQPYRLA